ncbi:MAG: type I DNA topoisomerase [Proteobacteria bacterium]|nr:type I DNA topoisomerase [Pseudomonadota bacterium]
MSKSVVIVESPSKIASVGKYLGKDFDVLASYGHIRDLPSKTGSVDPLNDFKMIWDFGDRGGKSLAAIEKALKNAENLYLATDPDREGEAISWHVIDALKNTNALKNKNIYRIVFNEITKTAVQNAIKAPRAIDQSLVDAYLARRALDYLVGFTLSPVLWRKLPGARSAGRVQSVALRIIVEREEEIEKFNVEEYWTINGLFLNGDRKEYSAKLTILEGKKLQKFDIANEQMAKDAVLKIKQQKYTIDDIEKKQVKRNPTPPFITSTLQQEAARKLGFSGKKTMQMAQKLYEGTSIDGETTGLITYMRTDSINLSNEALENIRGYIPSAYGEKYLPKEPRVYKSKAKNAQEAHEAIRPTDIRRSPKDMAKFLSNDELKLYDLIWKRALSSQMESAIFDQVGVDIVSNDKKISFRATGSTLVFDGFLSVYQEGKDEDSDDDQQKRLPLLQMSDEALLKEATPDQHFTQPPPRFTEATLVKKLEELGIGRPSTYVSIIQVLQDRKYVVLEKKQFKPEDRGRIVTSFLKNHFKQYVEYDFTAQLEEQLDDISAGTLSWLGVMDKFWTDFSNTIAKATEISIASVISEVEKDLEHYLYKNQKPEERICPTCKKGVLNLKLSKFGAFLGCSDYPECSYTKPLVEADNQTEQVQDSVQGVFEPRFIGKAESGQSIFLKKGPYGFYIEWEALKTEKKPKRVSIPSNLSIDDIDLQKAQSLGAFPKKIGTHPEYGDLLVNTGRFGPYVQSKAGFVSIPKADDYLTLSFERAVELIIQKVAKGPSKRGAPKKKS